MKKTLYLLVLFFVAFTGLQAKDGYKIRIQFKHDIPDETIYLARYFAKPPPTIYKIDSGKVINKRTVTIETKDSILGGIYMVLFDKNTKYQDILVDNGLDMEMIIDTTNMPEGTVFKGSPENTRHADFQKEVGRFGRMGQELSQQMSEAKTAADSQMIINKSKKLKSDFKQIQDDYVKKYPNTLLSGIFNMINEPEVPEGPHYLEDGKTVDSFYSFYYTKSHYWDKFDFKDNRLIIAPFYDKKLSNYFNNYVLPTPDTVIAEADILLAKTRDAKELFKYTLHWLAGYTEKNKLMGMDEAFVHLVEKYYMKGDAYWLDSAGLAKYIDRAQKIAPNVLGNTAPELVLQDVWSLQDVSLQQFQAPYTLMVFWSPDCGHCQKEIPMIDSVYNAELKQKGVKVFSIPTEGELTKIQEFIEKNGLKDWTNVVDAHNNSKYKSLYDVYGTPRVFLLDDQKKIIGKLLDHGNIGQVLKYNEEKKKKNSKS